MRQVGSDESDPLPRGVEARAVDATPAAEDLGHLLRRRIDAKDGAAPADGRRHRDAAVRVPVDVLRLVAIRAENVFRGAAGGWDDEDARALRSARTADEGN